ncbi:MAG: PAS domain-containing sensor histidine kinase [Deltaproteobacteria bacterium]|nr:PAS domain-containing sensor histidine kinase [Deltaproteobacteria bacterium]
MTDLLQDLSLLLELSLGAGEADNLESFSEELVRRLVGQTRAANGLLFVRGDFVESDSSSKQAFVPLPSGRARFLVGTKELDADTSGIAEAIRRKKPALLPGRLSAAHRSGHDVLPALEVTLQVPFEDAAVLELYARSAGILDERLGKVLGSLSGWLLGMLDGFGARAALRARTSALERTRSALLELSTALPGVPWVADGYGRLEIIGVGSRALFGRAPGVDITTLREAGLGPEDRHRVRRALAESLAERKSSASLTYRYNRGENDSVDLHEEIRFAYDLEGRPQRIVGFVGSVSEPDPRPSMFSSELLGTLVHEMRAALFPVIALSDLILQTPGAVHGEWVDQIRRIGDAGRRQLELLGDLSDLARAESGRLRPKLGPCDLQHVAQALTISLGPQARAEKIELRVEARPGPVTVYSDRTVLSRIAECLIRHALSGPRKTPVSLLAEVDLSLEVVRFTLQYPDPTPPVDALQLFTPFWERGARQNTQGLGLLVVSKIVQALGGTTRASTDAQSVSLVAEIPCALSRKGPVDAVAGRRILVIYKSLPSSLRAALAIAAMGAETSMLAASEAHLARHEPADLVLLDDGAETVGFRGPSTSLRAALASLAKGELPADARSN